MPKRLTDSDKWDDPWFRSLNPVMKSVWYYLCDKCDNAGVWKKDLGLMQFYIGSNIDPKEVLTVFNDDVKVPRIIDVGLDKWLITKFVSFQFKNNPKMHNHIKTLIAKHGISFDTLSIPYRYPIDTPIESDTLSIPYPQTPQKEAKTTKRTTNTTDINNKLFDTIWENYPKKLGRKEALRDFNATVKTADDQHAISMALDNYIEFCKTIEPQYIKHGSSWFNNWRDWVNYKAPQKLDIDKNGIPDAWRTKK